jgi:hypothetical protein
VGGPTAALQSSLANVIADAAATIGSVTLQYL